MLFVDAGLVSFMNAMDSDLAFIPAINEATFTWSGQLPSRNYKNPVYSCKVFLGGVPWDITEGEVSTVPIEHVSNLVLHFVQPFFDFPSTLSAFSWLD